MRFLMYLNFRRKCNRYIFHRDLIIDLILANTLKCLLQNAVHPDPDLYIIL